MKVLLTGATGLIGSELVRQCIKDGIIVHYLTTRKNKIENRSNYKGFYWNPELDEIDIKAFEGVTSIIHLAGANIAKRWTKKNKKLILESRTQTANLIFKTLKNNKHQVRHFISASGISRYPNSKTKLYTEEDREVDTGFLAEVVVAWEAAAVQFKSLGMEVTKVRTGVVFAKKDSAFQKIVEPIKLGVGAPLGSGKQWQSWIHIKDVAGIYKYILKNELEGIYNAVAPNPILNKSLTKKIASHLNKPLWLPNIPGFALRLLLGEMATLVLEGQLVSSRKIEENGYRFKFYNIKNTLTDLL